MSSKTAQRTMLALLVLCLSVPEYTTRAWSRKAVYSGYATMRDGHPKFALGLFWVASWREPSVDLVARGQAAAYGRSGDTVKANAIFQKNSNEFPTWHNALWSADEAMDAGMFKSAHEFFAASMQFDPKIMYENIIGLHLPTYGRTLDLALGQNAEHILVAPMDPFWWGVRSEIWSYLLTKRIGMPIVEIGDTAQAQLERMRKAAVSDATRLVERCPGSLHAYLHRAKIHHIKNNTEAADRDRATAASLVSEEQRGACK